MKKTLNKNISNFIKGVSLVGVIVIVWFFMSQNTNTVLVEERKIISTEQENPVEVPSEETLPKKL